MQTQPMPASVFECPTNKCGYAIASDDLNEIQLKALRRWVKRCPKCNKSSKWLEKYPLLDTKTIKAIGGQSNDSLSKTGSTIPKTESQKRRAHRYDRSH